MEDFFEKFDRDLEKINKDLELLYNDELFNDASLYFKKIIEKEND
jgi:hypothetical protein